MATTVQPNKQPFIGHVQELRRRLSWWALSLLGGAGVGYWFKDPIQAILIHPLHQPLFYTNPTGGFDFLIQICIFFGILVSIPVFIYNLLKFIQPVLAKTTRFLIVKLLLSSTALAIAGVTFAYFVSLPEALHFLGNFGNNGIKSLISTDEYLRFVMTYLAICALLFQLPLILLFINWIKPMRPKKLMKNQRWAILVSCALAPILTPAPDLASQAIVAISMIGMYQVSVLLIWLTNRKRRFNLDGKVVESTVVRATTHELKDSQLLAGDPVVARRPLVRAAILVPRPQAVAQTVPSAWSKGPGVILLQDEPMHQTSPIRSTVSRSPSGWSNSTMSQRTLDLTKQKSRDLYYRPSRNIIDMRPKPLTTEGPSAL